MTPSPPTDAPDARVLTAATGHPSVAVVTGTLLTMAGLRERGWSDVMIRDYLGEPDATRPNPRYRSAAPMKLYLAERNRLLLVSTCFGTRMLLLLQHALQLE